MMKNFLFTGLLFIVFLSLNENVLSQFETQEEYKKIPRPTPISFTFQTNPIIEQYLKYYQGRGRLTMEIGIHHFGTHEKIIKRIFQEESVPEDLCWIHQVEKMRGISVRALWLFPPSITKKYGLRKTKFIDETRSFEKATRAMAQYLKFLYQKYDGNWEMALGAYESGEGNVDYAIKRAKAKDYWRIYKYLPAETRNFVPNILAAILIAKDKQKYGFGHVLSASSLEYELVRIPPSVSLERIAEYCVADIKFIKYINPELITNITPPEIYIIRVPMGTGQIFAEKIRRMQQKPQPK